MAGYGSNEGLLAYLASMGMTLPEGADPDVLRQIGSNYLDAAYEWRLACSSRTGGFAQELAWPRTGHYVNGQPVPDDLIPPAWINASYRAAYLTAISPGWATTGTDGSRQVKRQRVEGAVEREFFSPAESAGSDVAPGMPSDSIINGIVASWLCVNRRSMNSLFRVI